MCSKLLPVFRVEMGVRGARRSPRRLRRPVAHNIIIAWTGEEGEANGGCGIMGNNGSVPASCASHKRGF